jgi:hypothetical protein
MAEGIGMADALFLCGVGTVLVALMAWGFVKLPGEEWQWVLQDR